MIEFKINELIWSKKNLYLNYCKNFHIEIGSMHHLVFNFVFDKSKRHSFSSCPLLNKVSKFGVAPSPISESVKVECSSKSHIGKNKCFHPMFLLYIDLVFIRFISLKIRYYIWAQKKKPLPFKSKWLEEDCSGSWKLDLWSANLIGV